MSIIPAQPYAKPPKLIVKTAMEMAAEFWEIMKMEGKVKITVTQKNYARQAWPEFLAHARETLINMLSGNYPETIKEEIYAAFLEEREAAEYARMKMMRQKPGFKLH